MGMLFFIVLTGVMTLRENRHFTLWIGIAGIAFWTGIVYLQWRKHQEKSVVSRRIKNVVWRGVVIVLACIGAWWRYTVSLQMDLAPSKSFIGTGIIQDTARAGKYVFQTSQGTYLFSTSQDYQILDTLFVLGTFSPGQTSPSDAQQEFLTFDYAKRLKMKGYQGIIYDKHSTVISSSPNASHSLSWRLSRIKRTLQQATFRIYGKNKISGLMLGMLIGDRSQISAIPYQETIDSWLVHIVAVSGGNIVVLTICIGWILFFLPFYLRNFCILLLIIGYGFLCGLDSSVFRAVIMGGLSLFALFRGKEIPIRRLLMYTCVGMLLIDPYYLLYDAGFSLSFGAVIGTVITSQRWKNSDKPILHQPKPRPRSVLSFGFTKLLQALRYIRKNYLQISLGASMGAFPFLIGFMGKINLFSIFANLVVVPLVPFVMMYGLASVVLHSRISRNWITGIETGMVAYIYKVAQLTSQFGLFLLIDGRVKGSIVIVCCLGFFLWKREKRK